MASRWGKMETVTDSIFLSSKITADNDCGHEIKTLAPWKKSYDKPRQHFKKQRHHFADKCQYSQSYGFSISHIWMWELDHKEGWMSEWKLLSHAWLFANPDSLCSLPGSSVHRILQARLLEWVAISFSERRLRTNELILLKCGIGEDSWESLGLQGDPTSPF